MQITINTREDSVDDLKEMVVFLEKVIQKRSPSSETTIPSRDVFGNVFDNSGSSEEKQPFFEEPKIEPY